jgi:hypothetical protein
LHVVVAYKTTLSASATCFGTAHGLKITVTDESALGVAPAGGRAAIGLLIGVLNKPTLA